MNVVLYRKFLILAVMNGDRFKVFAVQCNGFSLCAPEYVMSVSPQARKNFVGLRTTY